MNPFEHPTISSAVVPERDASESTVVFDGERYLPLFECVRGGRGAEMRQVLKTDLRPDHGERPR